ncbi:glycosyltransferase [Thalassoroseus pseudoceratinae]|uniref:glycosyltransferase n=1 Tax=Thalassoroseus pseudoceratinae TaxID=2713176 RepID=UPI0036F251FC
MNRVHLINHLLSQCSDGRYLEIGCASNRTFNAVQARTKVGVDPVRGGTVRATSDEFFQTCTDQFDVIFIDGLHLHEQVLRDVHNSLARLTPNGVIVLHDCLPKCEAHQLRQKQSGGWTGDVWKAIVELRQMDQCDTCVFEGDWGLGIVIPRPNSAPIHVKGPLTWSRFQQQRNQLMRVVNENELMEFLDGTPHDASPDVETIPEIPQRIGTNDRIHSSRKSQSPPSFAHLLLTRFNLGNLDPDWLEHRIKLFEQFTLPSVRSQSNNNFTWLLLCNKATPASWRRRLTAYENGRTKTLWLEGAKQLKVIADFIKKQTTLFSQSSYVITTRVDNDDVLHSEFVNMIQCSARYVDREFLNFPRGLLWARGRVRSLNHGSNSFISCVEPVDQIETVFTEQHDRLSSVGPIRQIASLEPFWMRVCHDQNILNRPPDTQEGWFPDHDVSPSFVFDREHALGTKE